MLCPNTRTSIFPRSRNVSESDIWCVVHTLRMKIRRNTPNIWFKNFPRTKKDLSIDVCTQHNFKVSFNFALYLVVLNFVATVFNCILPQLQY